MPRPLALVALVLAVIAAYANSFDGAFVFDDFPAIVENPHVRSLWPLSHALDAPPEVTTAGRPVAALSFALSYALSGGYDTWMFHAMNVAIHACAALVLFGVVRRTLLTPSLSARFGKSSSALAFAIALQWAVHPLHTQAVTYIVQRVESLMGLFLLLTVYAAIRAGDTKRSRATRWTVLSVVCCVLGMATKQTMVGAPLLVMLWDWIFARRPPRWTFYAALASTWILLAYLVVIEPRPHSVGSIEGWTPVSYLLTQGGVILHYLRLAVVPSPLVFDYDWRPAAGLAAVVPTIIVALLVLVTAFGVVRRQPSAFPAAWFFIILAPTSSVLPIATEVAAEHRMYLPLAAVIALLVAGAARLRPRPQWLVPAAAAILAVVFGTQTAARNRDYESDEQIWRDTIDKRPSNARARHNYAIDLMTAGRLDDAEGQARAAIAIDGNAGNAHKALGVILLSTGRVDEGLKELLRASELDPDDASIHRNLGEAHGARGDLRAAVRSFLRAAELAPDDPFVLNRAAWILATAPEADVRDGARALMLARHAVDVTGGQDPVSLDSLAAAHAERGEFPAAVQAIEQAIAAATRAGQADMLPELAARRGLYRDGRPFRTGQGPGM